MRARPLAPSASSGIIATNAKTPVDAALTLAVAAGHVATLADETEMAHDWKAETLFTKDASYKLEGDALDFMLHQHPENIRDLALLCLVACERHELLEASTAAEASSTYDAVACAMQNILGFTLTMLSPADIRAIPERMRDHAENMLANLVGIDKAQEAFA